MSRTFRLRKPIADERVKDATKKSLAHWFILLDRFDVKKYGHTAAADYLSRVHGIKPWWTQAVVIEYEYARNLRSPVHTVPVDLLRALKKHPNAQKAFDAMPPSHKKEYVNAVLGAKRPETRKRRIDQAIVTMVKWNRERKVKKR